MNKPVVGMWNKDYTEQWEYWIAYQIQENEFKTFDECLKHLIKDSDGRVNSRVVKRIYEELNK